MLLGDFDLADPYDPPVSERSKHELAKTHLESVQRALEEGDLVVAITFLHLAAEAVVVGLAEQQGIDTQRRHDRKATAATSLFEAGVLPDDLGPDLRALNELRKGVTYEGEEVDLSRDELGILADRIGAAVAEAEKRAS